jgi:diguanylate cyclase (GGDEF)-like protein
MRALQQELAHKASHDSLTELANRSVFGDSVREALDGGGRISVIFVDIDDFKTINDSLGHAAGDELLIEISRRLEDCVRPTDLVARIGGDEFAVMLQTCSKDEAIEITERIMERLGERLLIAEEPVRIGASAGIATCDREDVSREELIRDADLAMYQAKRGGKRSYAVFEPGMEVAMMNRHRFKQRLRDGVDSASLVAHYQPIVALDSGEVVAREALVRWLDGPNGMVQPRSFIPVAEEIGMIVPIGRLVLNQACQDAHRWNTGGAEAQAVHVNVSPVELQHPGFLRGVSEALETSGLSPNRLVFEITESVAMQTPEKIVEILEQLRAMGARIALDDFGTGYSSLSRLRRLPVDWLKVGPPLLTGAGQNVDRPLVTMILSLADSLGCQVIVEGIESEQQRAELLEFGCKFGQGFYLGMPAELPPTAGRAEVDPLRKRVPWLSSVA